MAEHLPLVLFDIDRTLINTAWLTEQRLVPALLKRTGLSGTEFTQVLETYRATLQKSTDFNPWDFFSILAADRADFSVTELNEEFFTPAYFREAVFSDVRAVLEQLRKKACLGIFSEGFEEYQHKKLVLSELIDFFDHEYVYIGRRKTSPEFLAKLPLPCWVVDDNRAVVEAIQVSGLAVHPIWLLRGLDFSQGSSQKFPFPIIDRLDSLFPHLEQQ